MKLKRRFQTFSYSLRTSFKKKEKKTVQKWILLAVKELQMKRKKKERQAFVNSDNQI